ncbi:EutN/CcmL family microcompartment protein [bacterium]|nr:EutN/CcmL family microcompartment protein [bacterium]
MIYAKVIGNIVATKKEEKYVGKKILMVQPYDLNAKKAAGDSFEAIDVTQAGIGDYVLVTVQGRSSRVALNDLEMPIDAVIVAIVDKVYLDEE